MKTLRGITDFRDWCILAACTLLFASICTAPRSPKPWHPHPSLTVKRAGRLLTLDYQLLDADGQKFRNPDRNHPPRFTVYQGDRLVGSGTFEYG